MVSVSSEIGRRFEPGKGEAVVVDQTRIKLGVVARGLSFIKSVCLGFKLVILCRGRRPLAADMRRVGE